MVKRKLLIFFLARVLVVLGLSVFLNRDLSAAVKIPEGEIWLIVRGDDIGFSHGANLAFEECYKNGILTSAEIMVPPPWFNEAVKILNENPGLEVGVHLDLTCEWLLYRWGPVAHFTITPSFIDEDGYFYYRTDTNSNYDKIFESPYSFLEVNPKLNEVEKELRAQIEMSMEKIPRINHLSCHMGTAMATPELEELVGRLAEEYGLVPDWKFRDNNLNIFFVPPEEKEDSLASILKSLEPGLWYLVIHPGMDTPEMRAIYNNTGDPDKRMSIYRAAVTKALISKRIKRIIKERGIKLVTHQDVIDKGLLK